MQAFESTPKRAANAVTFLAGYVQERALAVEKGQITTTADAVRLMDELFHLKEDLAARAKSPVEKLYDILRFTVIPNLMDGEGLTNIGVEHIGKVHLQDDVSVTVENKDGLRDWLTENQLEDMITESVNAQTLAAFVRRRIREAAEKKETEPDLPSGKIIKIKPIVRAVITRG